MKRLHIFCLVLTIVSCSNRTGIPGDIIEQDTMRNILRDVVLVNEYAVHYVSQDTLKKDKVKANQDLLEAVFRFHHISREAFIKSLNFYESRPDLDKLIFDSLAAYSNKHKPDLYVPRTPLVDTGKNHLKFPLQTHPFPRKMDPNKIK